MYSNVSRRPERVGVLLRSEISDLVQHQLKDPRVGGLVSITEVAVTADLKHAKVFVSVMGSEEEKRQALRGLRAAGGFLRKELRGRLSLRSIPELSFCPDDSIEQGDRVLRLIKEFHDVDSSGEGSP